MTGKQKKTLTRILVTFVIFVFLMVIEHMTSLFAGLPTILHAAIFVPPYLLIGYDVIRRALKNIRNGQVFDENFLMMVATFAAFGVGEYDEALAVMLFYQVGELFQSYAVGKSRQSITDMMKIAPEYANLATEDGGFEQVDPEDVPVGATILIRPGEKIPLDGTVLEGDSFIDTAALTGESVPRRTGAGEDVISGCVNGEGILKVRVTKIYEDSTVSRILEMVENASAKKAHLEKFITRFARIYTPFVTISAVLLALVPPLVRYFLGASPDFSSWILRACVFLIVSCPCALVISVPLGFFGGIGAASRIGVLVKGSNYLEAIARTTTVVMDKTGTLTRGEFKVSRIEPAEGITEERLLSLAVAAESLSTHPIAASIRQAFRERGGEGNAAGTATGMEEHPGRGISCLLDGKKLLAGNAVLLSEAGISEAGTAPEAGSTLVYVAYDGKYCGRIVISDTIKEGAAEAIRDMRRAGVKKFVMLTGDRQEAAKAVADTLAIDEVRAGLLPADKVQAVEELLGARGAQDALAFVGDGINDAPVLMRADVGIAMGSLGSDAAIEAADIVLMDDDVTKIARLKRIGRRTMKIVRQNVIFAIGVKVLVLVLGALGIATMWLAVFADVGVAVLAILNSMRALRE